MITTKKKIVSVLVLLLLSLMLAADGAFHASGDSGETEVSNIADLEGNTLGGIVTWMPNNSAKILFESILGVKLFSYHSYQSMDGVLYALRSKEVSAVWVPDVTADWLVKTQDKLLKLTTDAASEPRLEFALALKPSKGKLRDDISAAILELKDNGTLDKLRNKFIDWENEPAAFYEKDMKIRGELFSETIYIGVTGATPPLDLLDQQKRPVGFSVAFMDEIGMIIGKNIEYVVLANDTAFSNLMNGKVDALFCYGLSKSTMDPGATVKKKEYIMTEGYFDMYQYSFLALE